MAINLEPINDKDPKAPRDLEYTVVQHDGTGAVGNETFHFDYHTQDDEEGKIKEGARFAAKVLDILRTVQTDKGMNVRSFTTIVM